MSSQLSDKELAKLMPSELVQYETPIPTQIVSSDEFYPDPNLKAYVEFDSQDRPSGWNGWATLSFSPSVPLPSNMRSAMITK